MPLFYCVLYLNVWKCVRSILSLNIDTCMQLIFSFHTVEYFLLLYSAVRNAYVNDDHIYYVSIVALFGILVLNRPSGETACESVLYGLK